MGGKVTAVDSGIKEDMLRSIGADHFIDNSQEYFTRIDQSYDIIFNIVVLSSGFRSGAANSPIPIWGLKLANIVIV
ncbi:MAG: D-arabinose 1-dehydrogenase-like Zn-dependent alcohol dehydrogenase [Halieaceae bacterium]|jgi:D-arabinose 1-dehydrogenase-like Zn-dependent alcohol dehydrogenase